MASKIWRHTSHNLVAPTKTRAAWVLAWAVLGLSPTVRAQDASPISFLSLRPTAEGKRFDASFVADNHDRDPLGADVFDIGFRFRLSGHSWDLFSDVVVDRVISMPEAPPIPAPFRDVIVPEGSQGMFAHSFVSRYPYVDKRGTARVSSFVPGDVRLGGTWIYWNNGEGTTAGLSAALTIPLAKSVQNLRSGTGTGGVDWDFGIGGTTTAWGGSFHGRASFVLTGRAAHSDQIIFVRARTTPARTETVPLPIGNRFEFKGAYVHPLTSSVSLSLEGRSEKELANENRIDTPSPFDLIASLQLKHGRFRYSIAALRQMHPLKSGELRQNPFGGFLDLTNVSAANVEQFLARNGYGATVGLLRPDAHVVLASPWTGALPLGAVVIPATYQIRSEHQTGYVFSITFEP